MLFFAFIDPLFVVDSLNIAAIDSRNAGYAIGFFFPVGKLLGRMLVNGSVDPAQTPRANCLASGG